MKELIFSAVQEYLARLKEGPHDETEEKMIFDNLFNKIVEIFVAARKPNYGSLEVRIAARDLLNALDMFSGYKSHKVGCVCSSLECTNIREAKRTLNDCLKNAALDKVVKVDIQPVIDILNRLMEWSVQMGGWEATIWNDVENFRDQLQLSLGSVKWASGKEGVAKYLKGVDDAVPLDMRDTGEEEPHCYRNFYRCSECGEEWEDTWSCMCNDRCPKCNAEIEPYKSEDLECEHMGHDDMCFHDTKVHAEGVSSMPCNKHFCPLKRNEVPGSDTEWYCVCCNWTGPFEEMIWDADPGSHPQCPKCDANDSVHWRKSGSNRSNRRKGDS